MIVVYRAQHMFLKVNQTYHVVNNLTSLRPSQMKSEGCSGMTTGIGDDILEGANHTEAGYRESTR